MYLEYLKTEIVTLSLKHENYIDVFSSEESNTIPKDTYITHTIDLQEGKEVSYGPIYYL